jgi:hypothetical protein
VVGNNPTATLPNTEIVAPSLSPSDRLIVLLEAAKGNYITSLNGGNEFA